MGKNRDRLRIVASVLEATNLGSNKTRIMIAANLSFKLLEKYLDMTISAGLIQINGSVYLLTESGREFLRQYYEFYERSVKAQQLLEVLDSEHAKLARLLQNLP